MRHWARAGGFPVFEHVFGAAIIWRRIDIPGHDACRVDRVGNGGRLTGSAVFGTSRRPVQLTYSVDCDARWRSRHGTVTGWIGSQFVRFAIEHSPIGEWTLNGAPVSDLEGCVDLDLGFTPATNFLQLRRLDLAVGQAGDAPAAWLDVEAGTLDVLPQRYERRSETTYWYEAPRFDYAALLTVTSAGIVLEYPGLWEAED